MGNEAEIIVKGIVRVITVLSISIIFGSWVDGCKVSPDIIIECQEACDNITTTMESVTSRECKCTNNKEEESPWLLN
jgi:hypothetical protein